MNIAVCKVGQKIIFDRTSKSCKRSNTNGNVGTYLLLKMLIEKNKNHNFYIVSGNDLCNEKELQEKGNVFDASMYKENELDFIDVVVVLSGLANMEKDERLINIINNIGRKYVLISDDPRCLDSISNDSRFYRTPDEIVSQFDGWYKFKDKFIQVKYEPIERASCYGMQCYDSVDYTNKEKDVVVIANTSGDEYNRINILGDITKDIGNDLKLELYGRLSQDERCKVYNLDYKGEVTFDYMQQIIKKSKSVFMIPIRKGWVTSKYVEALMNGCLPVAYKDYGLNLIREKEVEWIPTVSDRAGLERAIKWVTNTNYKDIVDIVNLLRDKMIKPYIDGDILNSRLMNIILK